MLFPTLPHDKFRARFPRAPTENPARAMPVSLLRTRPLSDAGVLDRERVLFIGTQFSNLYTAVDTSARGRGGPLYTSNHSLRKNGPV